MAPKSKHLGHLGTDHRTVRAPGIERVTLTYDDDNMMCYFYLKKGASLPLHTHPQSQNGLVMKGRVDFKKGDGEVLELVAGDAYYFGPMDPHGLQIHEDAELLEVFTPARDDYKD